MIWQREKSSDIGEDRRRLASMQTEFGLYETGAGYNDEVYSCWYISAY